MSATAATGKFVNFTILENELETLERKLFAPADHKKLERARRSMFEKLRIHGHNQLEVGLAVRRYHNFYVLSKGRNGRKRLARVVMRAIGVDSLKSVYNLMRDVDFVKEHLTGEWPGAFIKCGMDPVARKNREFILQFEESVKGKPTPNEAEAEQIAKDAIDEYLKQKKKRAGERREKAKDPAVVRSAIVERIARFLFRLPESERQTFVDGIAPEVWASLNALKARPAKTRGAASAAAKPASRSKLAVVSSPTRAPALPPQLSTDEPQPASIQPGSKPALVKTNLNPIHPWGDQCLDTLEPLGLGPRGVKQGRFNRDQLYQIRETRTPTRYVIGGLLDLFEPGLEDKYIVEHLNIFEEAYWHRFLVMTPHVDRVRIQSDSRKAITRGRGFPRNLWIGTTIECPGDLWRLRTLHKTGIVPRWVSFAGYRSDRSRPLSTSTLMKDLEDCAPRLVVIGWDLANAPQDLTIDDACTLANAASHFGSIPFFHTHPGSRNRFLHGQTPALATKSIVQDRSSAALIESAEQLRRLPDEWLRMPFPPKNMKFEAFKGAPVEVFQLRP